MRDLVERMQRQRERALASGELQPTRTEEHELVEAGHRFVVREIVGNDQKRRSKREQARSGVDPFLPPYESDLFVGDVSPSHVALLNKFPVARDHLLIVTREFEPQERALSVADFDALAICMREQDGLGFYNAGAASGASQPHKHLQLVPLPIGAPASAQPAPPLPTAALFENGFERARFRFAESRTPESAAEQHAVYVRLLREAGVDAPGPSADPGAYNLLVTRERMWLVPRSRASFEGVGANALGYAGSLLVRSPQELATLRALGPLRLLTEVGLPGPA